MALVAQFIGAQLVTNFRLIIGMEQLSIVKTRKAGYNSLVHQQRALRSHLDLMHSALLNKDAIKLANKKIVLQKGILAIGQKKLEKYAESSRLLAVARSQDALAIENFTKACRKYMDGEFSKDSLEREYRRVMAKVEVMRSAGLEMRRMRKSVRLSGARLHRHWFVR